MNTCDQMGTSDRFQNKICVYEKMENLIREMQNPDNGIPVRSQKMFLTSIPSVFMGYDLIEWLMEKLSIEEAEALNLANLFCSYGYFFPINDSKILTVKDDSSLYRFQSPCYWPGRVRNPDNIEYAIYLFKKSLKNKQRHGGLDDYEVEALNNLKRNLQNKLDFITIQAEEQIKTEKDRKKGDKAINESQERAFWRIYKPPPGVFNILDQFPIQNRNRDSTLSIEDMKRKVNLLQKNLLKVRIKTSQALESFILYVETYTEFDPFIGGTQPSNPWVSDDVTYWQLNNPLIEIPTEKRVKRWSLSMEELVSDPTGLREFTTYLRKEYSHENIRFWLTVCSFRHSPQSQVFRKVHQIYQEFLAPGAPCEINIDGKTMEEIQQEMLNPSRFTFDAAAKHVYDLLLKKDCYPRFIRSEHYKNLLTNGAQNSQKKRFFVFGPTKKKPVANTHQHSFQVPNFAHHNVQSCHSQPTPSSISLPQPQSPSNTITAGCSSAHQISNLMNTIRRHGSDRSLTGSAKDLPISNILENIQSNVHHFQSQQNLSDIPYREELLPEQITNQKESPKSLPEDCEESPQILSLALIKKTNEENRSRFLIQQSTFDDDCIRNNLRCDSSDRDRKNIIRRSSLSVLHTISEQKNATSITITTTTAPITDLTTKRAINSSKNDNGNNDRNLNLKCDDYNLSYNLTLTNSPCSLETTDNNDVNAISCCNKAPLAEPEPESSVGAINISSEEHQTTEICPWDDDMTCKSDGTFVKTYATLGYL